MLLIHKRNFQILSPTRLIKVSEAATVTEAHELLAAAELEAKEILNRAKAAFVEEKQRGYYKGLEDGKKEIIAQKLHSLDDSVQFMHSIENKMTDIVMKALKKCISEMDQREVVIQIIHKLMDAVVRNQKEIVLRVAPEMTPTVKAKISEIQANYPTVNYIDVQEDPRLKGTSCVIETEAGVADASIETQLAAIEESLHRHFSKEG